MSSKSWRVGENIAGRYANQSDLDRAREALKRATEYEIERLSAGMNEKPEHEQACDMREIERLKATIQ